MFYLKFLSIVLLTSQAIAGVSGKTLPRRISAAIYNLETVRQIYMTPGMATVIEIPGPVSEVIPGSPSDFTFFTSKQFEREVKLFLVNANAQPTNLIVRSGKKKYVFDIVPSKTIHQDVVEGIGAYGGPALDAADAVLIDSSDKTARTKSVLSEETR